MQVNLFGAPIRELFGFSLEDGAAPRSTSSLAPVRREPQNLIKYPSFVPPNMQDGTVTYEYGSGVQSTQTNFDEIYQTENELIRKYRQMSFHPECDMAIDDIINGMVVAENDKPIVSINLDKLQVSEEIKERIRDEFQVILKLYNYRKNYYELSRRWYVDGRMYHHIVIDPKNPKKGIQELRYIDPRQIRKIRGVHKVKDVRTGVDVVVSAEEFFLYNPMGILSPTSYQGIPIATDSISFCHAGVISEEGTMLLSHMHKAIRPLNQLKMMEDAVVIYRITRAPERRVFKIDVGNLPSNRAERHVRDMMERFKNRLVYNASTGEAGDDRRYMAMQEDFFLPVRDGGRGTQIDTLEGGQNLGEMADVDYFLKEVYKSLNIPLSRLDANNGFNLGRATEITRDEIDFQKFIERLRDRMEGMFADPLRVQLILKGITTESGWDELSELISFDWNSDSYFSELKHSEIMDARLGLLDKIEPYIGRYYSHSHVRHRVLMQSEDDVTQINQQIEQEQTTGMFSVKSGKVIPNMRKDAIPELPGVDKTLPTDGDASIEDATLEIPLSIGHDDTVGNGHPSPTKYSQNGTSRRGSIEGDKIPRKSKSIRAGKVIGIPAA